MNREDRRKEARETKGYYFVSKKQFDIQMKKQFNAARRIALQQCSIIWNCFMIAAHEKGMEGKDLEDLQNIVKRLMMEPDTAEQLRERCLRETGVDCTRIVADDLEGENIDDF